MVLFSGASIVADEFVVDAMIHMVPAIDILAESECHRLSEKKRERE